MKSIDDNIICKQFSLKESLRYRLINKYFNKLVCDGLDDIIWYDVCDSLQFIPTLEYGTGAPITTHDII